MARFFCCCCSAWSDLPVPDETLLVYCGYLISKGVMHPAGAFFAALAGSWCGISLSYTIGRTAGIGVVHRFGKYLHITEERLDKVHAWFDRVGHWALFIGYYIAGVRHFTAIVAGTSKLQIHSLHGVRLERRLAVGRDFSHARLFSWRKLGAHRRDHPSRSAVRLDRDVLAASAVYYLIRRKETAILSLFTSKLLHKYQHATELYGRHGGRDFLHLRGLGKILQGIGFFHRHADAQIARRQHVVTTQREHQEHVDGPDADAFDTRQMLHDGIVFERRALLEIYLAIASHPCQLANVFHLCPESPSERMRSRAQPKDRFRRHRVGFRGRFAGVQRWYAAAFPFNCCDTMERTRVSKPGSRVVDFVGSGASDNGGQNGVGLLQVGNGFFHGNTFRAACIYYCNYESVAPTSRTVSGRVRAGYHD